MIRALVLTALVGGASVLSTQTALAGPPPQAAASGVTATAASLPGDWKLQPAGEAAKAIDMMKLVLRDPMPTQAEIDALQLDAQGQQMAMMMMSIREANPSAPEIAAARQQLASMDTLTMRITGDTMTLLAEGVEDATRPYRVDGAAGNTLTVTTLAPDGTPEPSAKFIFLDANTIEIREGGQVAMKLTRR